MIDIFEGATLTLEAELVDGVPRDNRASLCVQRRGMDLPPEIRAVSRPGETVLFDHVAENVADAEESYVLVCKVKAEEKTYVTAEYRVWPRRATVKASDTGTTDPRAGFLFQLVQGGGPSATIYRTEPNGVSDPFPLEKGAFTIQAAPPWEIVATTVATGRKREVEVEQKFEAEIVAPVEADYTPDTPGNRALGLRQYVNLDTARSGRDGLGHTLSFLVGAKGDRPKAPGDRVATAARKVYVKVTFSTRPGVPGKVRRTAPKRELLAAGVTHWTEVAPEKEYTGEVFFTEADQLATFTVELGRTGNDKCKVQVGSTSACGDAAFELWSWRKIYYELMAVDAQGFNDLPPVTITELRRIGKHVAIEYVLDRMHVIPEATMPRYTMMPKSFIDPKGTGAAPPRLVSLTPSAPFAGFAHAKGTRSIGLWLCDMLWSQKGAAKTLYDQVATTRTPKFPTMQGAALCLWHPRANLPGDNLLVSWSADVDQDVAFERAAVAFAAAAQADVQGAKLRTLAVQGPVGAARNITFADGTFGIATAVSAAGLLDLQALVAQANDYATLHAANNVATFTITADISNNRKLARVDNIKAAIRAAAAALAGFGISRHPGLDANGDPCTGNLSIADLDLASSAFCLLAFNLPFAGPTDPGSFVGAATDHTCPILLDITFQPHVPIGGGAKPNLPEALITLLSTQGFARRDEETAYVIAHELGHKMKMSAHGRIADALAPGLPQVATVGEAEPRYPVNGANGHVYVDKGHQGAHCAYGFSDDEKRQPVYLESKDADAECLMFGRVGADRYEFCEQCVDYICALDLVDIESSL